jgi:hypothetical protein
MRPTVRFKTLEEASTSKEALYNHSLAQNSKSRRVEAKYVDKIPERPCEGKGREVEQEEEDGRTGKDSPPL